MDHSELEAVADQYRHDGYTVLLRPNATDLPEFLQRHEIDLLASRGNEQVVVEVKRKGDLKTEHHLAYLASEVNARKGWRFDMIVVNGHPWSDEVAGDSREPDQDRIHSLANAAERLLAQGELEASCMMAWSAVEAALRDAALRAGISLERKTAQYVLNVLATEGILSRKEFEDISGAYRVRNAVAHGLSSGELSADVSNTLIQMARRLLDRQMTTTDA